MANRSDFDRKLVQEWVFRQRYATALSLLIVDIDHFKQLNEEWGHVAGDAILREVARRLASRLRRTEVLARTGGDEFAVIVPQYRKEALAIAEQLREQIAEAPFHLRGERPTSVRVTVSVGIAEASDVDTPRELLACASDATAAAKAAGRNAVESYRPQRHDRDAGSADGGVAGVAGGRGGRRREASGSRPAAERAGSRRGLRAGQGGSTASIAATLAAASPSDSSPYSVSNASASRPFSDSPADHHGHLPMRHDHAARAARRDRRMQARPVRVVGQHEAAVESPSSPSRRATASSPTRSRR